MAEFELIARITDGLTLSDDVMIGPGDDAAVLGSGSATVVSTDILVEDVHFKRGWSMPHDIGRKAVAVNVSDVESMGARPTGIVIAVALPEDADEDWALALSAGIREEAERANISVVGGDLSKGDKVVVCGTALGALEKAPVTRSGAREGDVVAVCGNLGWASAGLTTLQRGFRSPVAAVEQYRCPSVPYGQGLAAAQAGATAMIDVSDGLLADLGHISDASKVAIDIHTERIAVPEVVQRISDATGKTPWQFILAGGEDHALVATFPPEAQLPPGWDQIGAVQAGAGVTVDGEDWELETGWDHFR